MNRKSSPAKQVINLLQPVVVSVIGVRIWVANLTFEQSKDI